MLPSHVERAEERFTVERRRVDESVGYEVFAFVRPSGPPAGQSGSTVRAPGPEAVRG